ncbi:MAG: helix-turn-helix transcriptional regulator [Deltaproteobacteria bacterium]|nr:helix-turn-helix transcriptional regulator [Deltaproteobacteria bacterium]
MTDVQKTPRKRSPAATTSPRRAREEGERRTERTRAVIREAANALFLEHGVDSTTVDAICAGAGISKGTFYLYFHRKEDLLLEYGVRRLRRLREMLPELISRGTFREAINAVLDEVVRGKDWGREVTGRAILEMGTCAERLPMEAPHRLIQPLIEIGQARGEIRKDIPTDALAHFVLRSILGALRDWGLGTDEHDRETTLNYALTLVFDAIEARR